MIATWHNDPSLVASAETFHERRLRGHWSERIVFTVDNQRGGRHLRWV